MSSEALGAHSCRAGLYWVRWPGPAEPGGGDEGWGLPAGRCCAGGCDSAGDRSQWEPSPGASSGSPAAVWLGRSVSAARRGKAGLDGGRGRWPRGVSNPEREPSPSGQGTVPPWGLGAEVLGAPSGGRRPERLWGWAGCPWLRGTLLGGRDGASGDSTRVSLALSRGTAQPGAGHQGGLDRVGPMPSPAGACGPFQPVDAQTLSWDSL